MGSSVLKCLYPFFLRVEYLISMTSNTILIIDVKSQPILFFFRICQFTHVSTDAHLVALKRILHYLCGMVDYGILIKPFERLSLVGFANGN